MGIILRCSCLGSWGHGGSKRGYFKIITVVHDGSGDILAGDALCPGGGHVEVELWFAAVLAGVLQVPLVHKQGVGGVGLRGQVDQVFHFEGLVAALR